KMNKAVILLVALTLCSSKLGCRCIKTTSQRVALRTVAKVEVTPPSGRCRRSERVVIRKNGSKVCIKLFIFVLFFCSKPEHGNVCKSSGGCHGDMQFRC
uniref:Chemokine interleukin-8-like domain-containing protein n=1 Tax=Poecilia reticulata TaxID=8081 RepID=A0A3P9N6N8_POERE